MYVCIYIYTYIHIYIYIYIYILVNILRLRARATLGTVRKKMSPGKVKVCKSCTTQYIYSYCIGNDYYFQIIIEVAQLRQHKQRLNDLRMQLG